MIAPGEGMRSGRVFAFLFLILAGMTVGRGSESGNLPANHFERLGLETLYPTAEQLEAHFFRKYRELQKDPTARKLAEESFQFLRTAAPDVLNRYRKEMLSRNVDYLPDAFYANVATATTQSTDTKSLSALLNKIDRRLGKLSATDPSKHPPLIAAVQELNNQAMSQIKDLEGADKWEGWLKLAGLQDRFLRFDPTLGKKFVEETDRLLDEVPSVDLKMKLGLFRERLRQELAQAPLKTGWGWAPDVLRLKYISLAQLSVIAMADKLEISDFVKRSNQAEFIRSLLKIYGLHSPLEESLAGIAEETKGPDAIFQRVAASRNLGLQKLSRELYDEAQSSTVSASILGMGGWMGASWLSNQLLYTHDVLERAGWNLNLDLLSTVVSGAGIMAAISGAIVGIHALNTLSQAIKIKLTQWRMAEIPPYLTIDAKWTPYAAYFDGGEKHLLRLYPALAPRRTEESKGCLARLRRLWR